MVLETPVSNQCGQTCPSMMVYRRPWSQDVLVIFGSTPLNHGPQILSVGHIRSLPPGTTEVVIRLEKWGEGEQEPSKSKGDSWHIMPES
jgi:hypothetical protein